MEQMLDSVAPEDKEHWLSRANAESFGLAWSTPDAECYHLAKWRSLHREAFRKAGLAYPPVFSDRLQTVIKISSLREREAEVLHYHERLWPVESITCHEVFRATSLSSCSRRRRSGLPATTSLHTATTPVSMLAPAMRWGGLLSSGGASLC